MIKVDNLTKRFENFTALSGLNCTIPKGCIYGLVGSNGAGKSTFLRLITGIYKPTEGKITVDDENVWDNPRAKEKFVFIPDESFFLPMSSINRMAKLYASVYPNFDYKRLHELVETFGLDPKKNIGTFSKGMKRQASTALALSCKTDYFFFDETFDGLDPVMRRFVKNIIFQDVCDRQTTVVITSHSLRELEDTCDQLALLHKGGLIFEKDIQNIKTSLLKIQVAYNFDYDETLFKNEDIEILDFSKRGKVSSLVIRGDGEKAEKILKEKNPLLIDILPLSLEEVFIYEMESLGYTLKDIIE